MKTIEQILFPVDLTESSENLVPHVTTMIDKFQAQLHVLYIVRVFHYFTNIYVPSPSITNFEAELVEGARRKMNEFIQHHFDQLSKIHDVVIVGEPAEGICNYIKENQIDMVIMGTHGRKGVDRVIFGSVAGRVIKTASVPVLVINPFTVG